MNAEARIASSVVRPSDGAEELKTIAIFCGLGLLLSFVAALFCGLDFAAF